MIAITIMTTSITNHDNHSHDLHHSSFELPPAVPLPPGVPRNGQSPKCYNLKHIISWLIQIIQVIQIIQMIRIITALSSMTMATILPIILPSFLGMVLIQAIIVFFDDHDDHSSLQATALAGRA